MCDIVFSMFISLLFYVAVSLHTFNFCVRSSWVLLLSQSIMALGTRDSPVLPLYPGTSTGWDLCKIYLSLLCCQSSRRWEGERKRKGWREREQIPQRGVVRIQLLSEVKCLSHDWQAVTCWLCLRWWPVTLWMAQKVFLFSHSYFFVVVVDSDLSYVRKTLFLLQWLVKFFQHCLLISVLFILYCISFFWIFFLSA